VGVWGCVGVGVPTPPPPPLTSPQRASRIITSIMRANTLPTEGGLGFGVWGLSFGVWGLGFGVWGWGFGVWGLRFRVCGLRFGVWGLGFEVHACLGYPTAAPCSGVSVKGLGFRV